jgi:hypothetical protein
MHFPIAEILMTKINNIGILPVREEYFALIGRKLDYGTELHNEQLKNLFL